jgi:hypothetical protein
MSNKWLEKHLPGYYVPVRIKIHRIVLYIAAALAASWGHHLNGVIAIFFIVLLFQSEIFMNAANKTSDPNI